MRLTCLKCGHQFEVPTDAGGQVVACVCGVQFDVPQVLDTGTLPSRKAAERSRHKAFRAAGLVRNVGGFAFGLAALGVLFFPLGLVGAAIGIYTLTMLRGPLSRYSGREWALGAIGLGVAVFLIEGVVAMSWLQERRSAELLAVQQSAPEDLKRLRRAQVLHRATHSRYGSFSDFRFRPAFGRYTIYLGPTDVFPGSVEGQEDQAPLPEEWQPAVGPSEFTAVAVANLDDDPDLDVWLMNAHGATRHVQDDLEHLKTEASPSAETAMPEPGPSEGPPDAALDPEKGAALGDAAAAPSVDP